MADWATLIGRGDEATRDALTPFAGWLWANTDTNKLERYSGSAWETIADWGGGEGGAVSPGVFNGRLTLTTGTPIPTGDVTGAGTLYLTPFRGNQIALYDGANWAYHTLTEISLALTITSGKNYDIFVYDDDGTLTLEAVEWTNDTTRATALATQNGVLVKNGTLTKRYVGTIRASGSNTTEDSVSKRYVWNYYHRVERPMRAVDTTNTWTHTESSWRAANGSSANKVEYVCGVLEDPVRAVVRGIAVTGTGIAGAFGIGVDSSTANSAQTFVEASLAAANPMTIGAEYSGYPGIGYHYLHWIEYRRAGTVTFWGDGGVADSQSGMHASMMG